ncbi:MAG TPA: hypothetical protein VH044_02200 [Polyangiaceae bacterium]|nr:hypothetical protein [Polyangiaceae bacterium]
MVATSFALLAACATGCSDVGDNTSSPGLPEASLSPDGTAGDDVSSGDDAAAEASTGGGNDATIESSTPVTGDDGASPTEAGEPEAGESETGAPEASTEDASVPEAAAPEAGPVEAGAPEAGTPEAGAPEAGVPEAGTPDAAIVDASGPDSTVEEAGTPDAAVESGSDGGTPTACTAAPCATGGANSVQCAHSPTSDGVCTPTEALFVAHDIAAGNIGTDGQVKPYVSSTQTGSCYACLNQNACLDDDQQDVDEECSDSPDLTGGAAGSGNTLCLTALTCILRTDCQGPGGIAGTSAMASQENVQLCYCGGNNAGSLCSTAGAATNGLCVNEEAAGFGFAYTDNKDILADYGDQLLPTGLANALFQCAAANHCALCQ